MVPSFGGSAKQKCGIKRRDLKGVSGWMDGWVGEWEVYVVGT
jgi:hypothetical protein